MGDAVRRRRESIGATLRAFGWKESLALAAPVVLLAVLSIRDIGVHSFWRDEIASVVFAKHSVHQLVTVIGRDRSKVGLANMASYYLILHFWLWLGETEARIRLFSALAGAATAVPVYFLARRLAGWPAGLAAGAVLALHPVVIHYSQEARGYSLAMLITASLTLLVLDAVERRSPWPWLAYGLLGAFGLYVHFFIALPIAAHAGWVLATRRWPGWRAALAVAAPLAIAAVPVPLIIAQYGGGHGWIPEVSWGQLGTAVTSLGGGTLLLAATGIAAAAALVALRREPVAWLVAATFAVPIALDALMSMWKPLLVARYLVMCIPALAVLAGVGIVAARTWLARLALGAVVAVALILALPDAYADEHQQDWRSLGTWIAQEAAPGDRLLVRQWGPRMLGYYLDRFDAHDPPKHISSGLARRQHDPDARLWVVLRAVPGSAGDPILDELALEYQVTEQRSFGDKLIGLLLTPR